MNKLGGAADDIRYIVGRPEMMVSQGPRNLGRKYNYWRTLRNELGSTVKLPRSLAMSHPSKGKQQEASEQLYKRGSKTTTIYRTSQADREPMWALMTERKIYYRKTRKPIRAVDNEAIG